MKWKLILIIFAIGMCLPLVNAIIYADKYEWKVTYSNDEDYEFYIENINNIRTIICLYNPKLNSFTQIFEPRELNIYDENDKLLTEKDIFGNPLPLAMVSPKMELIDKRIIETEEDYYGYCKDFMTNNYYLRFGEHSTIFEFIKIIKARHLNSSRGFIADVYRDVQERDNNWTEPINKSQYLRITFEQNLTELNDITIYAKSKTKTNYSIGVYEKNKEVLLNTFRNVFEDKKYQIFLVNLKGSQDTFDLKILNSSIEFDYVIDPTDDFYVIALDNRTTEWDETGTDPYLGFGGGKSNINTLLRSPEHGDFNYSNLPGDAIDINSVEVFIQASCDGGTEVDVNLYDPGDAKYDSYTATPCGALAFHSFDATELTTVSEVADTKMFIGGTGGKGDFRQVVTSFLRVDYISNLKDNVPPDIFFTPPTDENETTKSENFIFVNVTVNDSTNVDEMSNVSTFIDFNDSIIGWWRMDEIDGGGNPDDFFGRINLRTGNEATQVEDGFFGYGWIFDGSADFLVVEYVDIFNIINRSNYTLSMWVKPGHRVGQATIMSQQDGTGTGRSWLLFDNNELNCGGGKQIYSFIGGVASCSTFATTLGEWIHVVLTMVEDGANDNLTFYINGVWDNSSLVESESADSTPGAPGHIFWGVNKNGFSASFNGTLDDVIIFNRTLNADEVKGLFANSSQKYLQRNFTNLEDGNYKFIAYAQDTQANVNMTELRFVTIGEVEFCWSIKSWGRFTPTGCIRETLKGIVRSIIS